MTALNISVRMCTYFCFRNYFIYCTWI